jgi:acetyltransferase-like isoleucine patch superfamily enzyme
MIYKTAYYFARSLKRLRDDPLSFLLQRVLRLCNPGVQWPVHFTSVIKGQQYIHVGQSTSPGICPGCYIVANQGYPIRIGHNVLISANVVIVAYNYLKHDLGKPDPRSLNIGVSIGDNCWIGANVVLLPGAKIESNVIIGAGSVVTRGNYQSYGVYTGNPARLMRRTVPE